jgi:hypothetical protein
MTADRRSASFFSVLGDVLNDEGDDVDEEEEEEEEEEEAHLGLDPPKATPAANHRMRDHDLGDVAVVLASRVAMVDQHEWQPPGLLEGFRGGFWLISCLSVAKLFPRGLQSRGWQQIKILTCFKMNGQ